MVNRTRRWSTIAAVIVTTLIVEPIQANTTATVARTIVNVAESLQITFETDQDVSGQPDFSALGNDFEILTSSRSTNVSITNGRMQRSARWIIEVMPKREGELVIPPITIDKESTSAVSITVTAETSGAADSFSGDIALEVDVDNLAPYVQGQIIFTVRVVHAVSFDQASLTEPAVTTGDAIIEQLGDDVAYESTRGSDRVAIIERRYAIFPQNSEPMTIAPLRFDARVSAGGRGRFGPYSRGRNVRRFTDPVEITPRSIPADYSGANWLPARQLMLVETSPDSNVEYRVGEPLTRTLTLQATGLSSSQLPEINAAIPSTIRQYSDQPILENRISADGMVGLRQEKLALIPSEPGQTTLPAIEIPWWNTASEQMEYATLAARTIQVAPALNSTTDAPPLVAAANSLSTPAASDDGGTSDRTSADSGESWLAAGAGTNSIWPWMSLVLALGWLATLIAWLRSRQRQFVESKSGPQPQLPTERKLLVDLHKACDIGDAVTAKTALLQWAVLQWPGNRIRSLGELAAQFDGELQLRLHELSQHIYAEARSDWDGASLWQSFFDRQIKQVKASPAQPQLEPLYR